MFHEIRFPTAISRAAQGGPERRTDVIVLGSGVEERNARWANSRRSYNAGYGVKSLNDLYAVIAFFEERRGRLLRLSLARPADLKSCPPEDAPTAARPADRPSATAPPPPSSSRRPTAAAFSPWARDITKPVADTVLRRRRRRGADAGTDFTVDPRHRPRHLPGGPRPGRRRTPSPPVSSSTCPCASTPTSSRSTSRASATAPSPPSPSSRCGCE